MFKKSWKTTLSGILLGIGMFLTNQTTGTSQKVGQVLQIAGSVLVGTTAKDSDVTGGTKIQ